MKRLHSSVFEFFNAQDASFVYQVKLSSTPGQSAESQVAKQTRQQLKEMSDSIHLSEEALNDVTRSAKAKYAELLKDSDSLWNKIKSIPGDLYEDAEGYLKSILSENFVDEDVENQLLYRVAVLSQNFSVFHEGLEDENSDPDECFKLIRSITSLNNVFDGYLNDPAHAQKRSDMKQFMNDKSDLKVSAIMARKFPLPEANDTLLRMDGESDESFSERKELHWEKYGMIPLSGLLTISNEALLKLVNTDAGLDLRNLQLMDNMKTEMVIQDMTTETLHPVLKTLASFLIGKGSKNAYDEKAFKYLRVQNDIRKGVAVAMDLILENKEQKERYDEVLYTKAQGEARDNIAVADYYTPLETLPNDYGALRVINAGNLLKEYRAGGLAGQTPADVLVQKANFLRRKGNYERFLPLSSVLTLSPEPLPGERPAGDRSAALYMSDLPADLQEAYQEYLDNDKKGTNPLTEKLLRSFADTQTERLALGLNQLSLSEAKVLLTSYTWGNEFDGGMEQRIEFHNIDHLDGDVLKYLAQNAACVICLKPSVASALGGRQFVENLFEQNINGGALEWLAVEELMGPVYVDINAQLSAKKSMVPNIPKGKAPKVPKTIPKVPKP